MDWELKALVITDAVVIAEHTTAGHHAAGRFLAGYVSGPIGKEMLGCIFALLAPISGAPMALMVGCQVARLLSASQGRAVATSIVTARTT